MFGTTLSTSMNVVLEFGVSFGDWSFMGGFRGPQIFKMSNFFRALYLPLCEFLLQISSYIDLKCLLCVCITVKTQCDKYQYLYKVGSYARSTLSICSLAPSPPPPFENSGSAPGSLLYFVQLLPFTGYYVIIVQMMISNLCYFKLICLLTIIPFLHGFH